MYKISVFRIQREILCCSIDFVSLVYLCKSNKLSTQIERVNHIAPSFHQIERFNQTLIRKSTSIHHLIKLRVIHIHQLDSANSILSFSLLFLFYSYHNPHLIHSSFGFRLSSQILYISTNRSHLWLIRFEPPTTIWATPLPACNT